MKLSRVLIPGVLACAVLSACADEAPESPVGARPVEGATMSAKAAESITIDDGGTVSDLLDGINADLAAKGAPLRAFKAELIVDPKEWDGSSTTIFANDRVRGLSSEWVAGDPRRDGRVGVTYAFDLAGRQPVVLTPSGTQRFATFAEVETQLEEGMTAWRDETCSDASITRVPVPTGVDPDLLDNLFLGVAEVPGRSYAQVSDIVQAGWQPTAFFTAFAGAAGTGILGVAFTFSFVDDDGELTDIDGNGKRDTGLVEIYYTQRYLWTNSGAPGLVDFYSIITHETGHSLGLAHFGKLFVTRRDIGDGVQLSDIKYAPLALMNAAYVTGRGEIVGTDRSSFCQIWASKN